MRIVFVADHVGNRASAELDMGDARSLVEPTESFLALLGKEGHAHFHIIGDAPMRAGAKGRKFREIEVRLCEAFAFVDLHKEAIRNMLYRVEDDGTVDDERAGLKGFGCLHIHNNFPFENANWFGHSGFTRAENCLKK